MKLIAIFATLTAFGFAYLYWVRPYLKTLPRFLDIVNREESDWQAIKVWLEGRKTILTGIWGEAIGMAPDVLQIASGVDLKAALHLPDNWALIISGIVVPFLMLIFRAKAKEA